jgi:hypothetical protein
VVNDPAEYSLRGVNDTADHWWAGSMTPPINILNCFFFYSSRDASHAENCFMIHSHISWPRSGDCGRSRIRTRDSCVLCLVSQLSILTPLIKGSLKLTRMLFPLKGISIKKSYISKLYYTISTTFVKEIWVDFQKNVCFYLRK